MMGMLVVAVQAHNLLAIPAHEKVWGSSKVVKVGRVNKIFFKVSRCPKTFANKVTSMSLIISI